MLKFSKLTSNLIILTLLFSFFLPLGKAHAQVVVTNDIQQAWANIKESIRIAAENTKDVAKEVKTTTLSLLQRAGMIAYKNAVRTFLSRLAYDTATRLAEGGIGQSPLFNIKSMGDFVEDVGQTTLADTLDILAKDNGFFNFDVCSPQDLDLKFAIHYSLFGNFNGRGPRGAPKCTLSEIAKTWTEWSQNVGRTYSSTNFLSTLRDSFKPEQNDIGIYLTVSDSLRSKIANDKINEQLDKIANQGFLPVTEKISGFIKTPAKVSADAALQLQQNAPVSETISTGDIVADSIGIFTNTLASKLLKQLFTKGLVDGQTVRSIGVYNWANREIARNNASIQLAGLAEVTYQSGFERTVDQMTQCLDANNPGPLDCVISSQVVGAIEQGLTVKEAISAGQLNAAGLVGFKSGGNPDYRTDFPYRSLVIMRINRIVPASWELAALYNIKNSQEKSLQQLIDCYEDPNNKDDKAKPDNCVVPSLGYNPYYHLIDPNWVLKAPESFCEVKGSGYQITASSLVCSENNVQGTHDSNNQPTDAPTCDVPASNYPDKAVLSVNRATDYCADRKSCLQEDDSGKCIGGYGYCLKEDPIWRFQGQACDAVYASCETFSVNNKEVSLIRDSLTSCDSGDVGCQWYSTIQNKEIVESRQNLSWDINSKVYLNASAIDCPAGSAGCTNLSRMIQGVNLMFNGDFELANNSGGAEGWQSIGNCSLSIARESFNNTNVAKVEAEEGVACIVKDYGFIPIDSRFQLVLGGNAKAEVSQNLRMVVVYFAGNQQEIGNQYATTTAIGTNWSSFKAVLPDAPSAAEYAKVSFIANGNVWYDNLQLAINKSFVIRHNNENYRFNPAVYQTDYSQNSSYAKEFLKVAPEALVCDGYNQLLNNASNDTPNECFANNHYWRDDISRCVVSGDASCANYTAYCSAEEVGCQGYAPINGDPEVSARTSAGDVCSAECVGYETYLETPSFFDGLETPDADNVYQNFIPNTAQSCTVEDAGCEEFTNLDAVAQGGEGKEYFTELRQCISQDNANLNFYYTWEGSDTTGFQLKKWSLLKSNVDASPCTNIEIGTEDCQDTNINQAICTQDDLASNPDCRDFFNTAGVHFYRLESKTVTASGECHPYRRTATGQVYNADPVEGKTCSPAVNNCREYKGNRGNNIRNVFSYNFEDGQFSGWLNSVSTDVGLNISNEAVYQGGHSLRFGARDHLLTSNLVDLLRSGKQYTLSFWAKKGAGNTNNITGLPPEYGNTLEFSQNGLTNSWQLYEIGPAVFNGTSNGVTQLKIQFNNLNNNEVIYLDNVVLKEYAESFYLIRDSWDTPNSCDDPYAGAQIGCQVYQDRQNQTHFLKSFDYLCSSTAIGCEAYANTQNSTAYQSSKSYQNNAVTVPNDKVVYLVNDPDKQCAPEYQGCGLLGFPNLDKTIADLTQDNDNNGQPDALVGMETVAKLNNPDKYDTILCSSEVQSCENFTGDLTNTKSYISPLGAGGDRTCEFNGTKWVKKGTSEDCPGAIGQSLAKSDDLSYEGWVGTCPAVQSQCTQFVEQNFDLGTNPNYYYLNNNDIDKQSCISENRAGGCIKFYDESLKTELNIKVKQDRKCSEWLECETGIEIPEEQGGSNFACLGLIKCTDDGKGGKVCANGTFNNGIYNLYENGEADKVNQLTGYSHPGVKWDLNGAIATVGYSSPELMSQLGQKVDVNNPGFEKFITSENDPENWSNTVLNNNSVIDSNYSNGNCSVLLDSTQSKIHSGRYSLKITLQGKTGNEDDIACIYHSQGEDEGYFNVDFVQDYVLSFYAKSQNGGQKARVGLVWYDLSGALCNSNNGYCNVNNNPLPGQQWRNGATAIEISPTYNGWQKYIVSFGSKPGSLNIPELAKFAKIYIDAHDVITFGDDYPLGSIWFDDFSIEPALSLNGSSVNLSSKECRLYPAEDAPTCSYQNLKSYEGWNGFCLEPDPFFQPDPTNPTNWDKCLQWYPVDSLQSDRLSVFNVADLGYQDRAPLYYCAQSSGNWNIALNGNITVFPSTYNGSALLETNPVGEEFKNRRPIVTIINGEVADDEDECGSIEDVPSCRNGTAHGICGCAEDTSISFDDVFAADPQDQFYASEIEKIEWIVQRRSHEGSWWDVGHVFVTDSGNNWTMVNNRNNNLNSFDVTVNFDANKRLESFRVYMNDGDDDMGGMWVAGIIYLREQCNVIAQTVKNTGGKIEEKAYLSRFNNWTWEADNVLGYSKNLSEAPYGSFSAPRSSAPEFWSTPGTTIDAPVFVYVPPIQNNVIARFDFGPSAGAPWSTGRRVDRVCLASSDTQKIGTSCLNSEQCNGEDGQGGVCSGFGKYCFKEPDGPPFFGVTNGNACNIDSDCGNINEFNCRLPLNLGSGNNSSGITRLQNLFAKIYGVWQWNGNRYEPCNNGQCEGFTYTPDISNTIGVRPAVNNVILSPNATVLEAPGGKVDLQFTVNGSQDQLPLESILIDWGDGTVDNFRGPLDYRPSVSVPYRAYHIYGCVQDNNGNCTSCFGNVTPINGTCTYPAPKINVKDHWEWCVDGYGGNNNQNGVCSVDNGVSANSSVIISSN